MKTIIYHVNAPAHRSKTTSQKLKETSWEIIFHSTYSPDLAPSDYQLFAALHRFIGTQFHENNEIKEYLDLLQITAADVLEEKY